MEKYLTGNKIVSSNGFWYDLTDGGYIIPDEILTDKNRVKELNDAIKLLEDWKNELEEDEMLEEN